jgi:hypothetical protein
MTTGLSDASTRLLRFQHGAIARWQAASVGLDPTVIDTLLRRGRWQVLYRGVYAAFTGHPTRECLLWAAVLRAGPGAVLSHHTAAELDRLTDHSGKIIHVTVGGDRRVKIQHEEPFRLASPIVTHRTNLIDSISHPVRTPPRTRVEHTILDLTQVSANFDDAFGWLCKGLGRRLVTPERIHAAMSARTRLRWRHEILASLPVIASGVHSNLEHRYERDVEQAHGLPAARRQPRMTLLGSGRARSIYLDNEYDPFGVVVELDGSAHHLVEDRWRDIHRDNSNARAGKVTLRYNHADVTCRACEVAAEVSDTLRWRGWDRLPGRCGPGCTLVCR